MRVSGGAPEVNMAAAVAMIRDAAARGCDIVVLPECLDLGWTHPSARASAEPIPGARSAVLCRAARETGIYVVAGLTELEDGRIYNAAVLVGPDGRLLHKHRKINILSIASDLYSAGAHLAAVETDLGTVGLLICADNFPETLCLGHSLARMGARLILSPCAWAVPADYDPVAEPYGELWRNAYSALAREHDVVVVGVSNVGEIRGGPWTGYQCIGCSLAVGPGGETLLQGHYGVDAAGLWVLEL